MKEALMSLLSVAAAGAVLGKTVYDFCAALA